MARTYKPSRVFTLVPGREALEAVKTPEGAQALYENICRALGITPKPADPPAACADEQPAQGDASEEHDDL